MRRAWARGSETQGSEGAEGLVVVLREGSMVGVRKVVPERQTKPVVATVRQKVEDWEAEAEEERKKKLRKVYGSGCDHCGYSDRRGGGEEVVVVNRGSR